MLHFQHVLPRDILSQRILKRWPEKCCKAGPVAQLAERWTPRGESTRPGYDSPGSKRDGRLTIMSLLTGMVAVGGRPQPGEVSEGTGS